MSQFDLNSLFPVLPEIILLVTSILVLLFEIANKSKNTFINGTIASFGLCVALGCTLVSHSFPYFKVFIILAAMISVLLGLMSKEIDQSEHAEMSTLLLLSTLGTCLMTSTDHFLVLFLAYEMVNFSCYILTAFRRKSSLSSEAGIKLFIQGALTSVFLAVGIALLYGIGKSFNILEIRNHLITLTASTPANGHFLAYGWTAFALIFIAVAVRMALFPFHFIISDVAQGAPTPLAAFLMVGPLIGGVSFAVRLLVHLFSTKSAAGWAPLPGFDWPPLIALISAATMTIGNLTALHQTNLKRLLGYSCVAQMGYLLMGFVVANERGFAAVLFSIAAYSFVTLGIFFVVQQAIDQNKTEDISALKGFIWRNPYEAVVLCLFILSLAGMPPLVGFVGRFYLLGVIVNAKYYWLSVVAVFNWVISVFYFLSLLRNIFSRPEEEYSAFKLNPAAHVMLAALWVPTLIFGIFWDPFMNYISSSLISVAW